VDQPTIEAGNQQGATPPMLAASARAPSWRPITMAITIYVMAFVVGAIVMSFEMLGSRYLNPYFGSGIYTWASLISTVLAALTAGYFIGGWIADRTASAAVLGVTVLVGSLYLFLLPAFAPAILEFVLAGIDDIRTGSLISALAILFFPVTFLGMYSPFAIRLLLRSAQRSGMVSGTVYGINTAGSIAGTLGTTFFLIPMIGTRAITLTLGALGILAGLALLAASKVERRRAVAALTAMLAGIAVLTSSAAPSRAGDVVDDAVLAKMLKHHDGMVAHLETEYNDVFIDKHKTKLTMSFQYKGWDLIESMIDLKDADALIAPYSRLMTVALAYAANAKKILMIGLGAGVISTYLGRAMPDATITAVELDPGVIGAAKKYFGLRESDRMRYVGSDGRVYLTRHKERYDVIIVDAFYGSYIPFHLLTKEFYDLLKQRLAPQGAITFNSFDDSKLFASTVKTLAGIFPTLDLYPSGEGETVIAVAPAALAPDTIAARAAALQAHYKFRYPLPELLTKRAKDPQSKGAKGKILTDDFAPVNLYNAIRPHRRKRKR
jgi:spermidine synthase